MPNGLRYSTGKDMPPRMLEKVAVKLVAELREKARRAGSGTGEPSVESNGGADVDYPTDICTTVEVKK